MTKAAASRNLLYGNDILLETLGGILSLLQQKCSGIILRGLITEIVKVEWFCLRFLSECFIECLISRVVYTASLYLTYVDIIGGPRLKTKLNTVILNFHRNQRSDVSWSDPLIFNLCLRYALSSFQVYLSWNSFILEIGNGILSHTFSFSTCLWSLDLRWFDHWLVQRNWSFWLFHWRILDFLL